MCGPGFDIELASSVQFEDMLASVRAESFEASVSEEPFAVNSDFEREIMDRGEVCCKAVRADRLQLCSQRDVLHESGSPGLMKRKDIAEAVACV